MQDFHSLRTGQRVDARGEPWRVLAAERFADVTVLTLRGTGRTNLDQTSRLLAPFDQVKPRRADARMVVASRHSVLHTALRMVTAVPTWSQPWSPARIEWRDWQWHPAAAVLRGATRVLLADGVGLGKTIQAALIVAELIARGLAERVLILAPASLREQWSRGLSAKFSIRAAVFDHAALGAVTASLPAGVNPWSVAPVIVSSIDLVKRPEVRTALDAVAFDILIVDEAHHLSPASDRGAVVADLAARMPWVILATATPHSGDDAAHRFLRELGDPLARHDLAIFRRSAADVVARSPRRTTILAIRPNRAERDLLDATLAYVRQLRRDDQSGALRLVAAVIARRAASSAVAAQITLERRLALLIGAAMPPPEPLLPWDEDDGDGDVSDAVLSVPGLSDRAAEQQWLEKLIGLARDVTVSSKTQAILRLLRRSREPLILFSEYRDVVRSLAGQFRVPLTTLHGGMSPHARAVAIDDFNTGRVRMLIATDAAGEGLNLQRRCRLVVSMELPWNPQRSEQRIGRVDRIGQTRTVHAIHLVHRDSYEDVVLTRHERRRRAAHTALAALTMAGAQDPGEISARALPASDLPDAAQIARRAKGDRAAAAVVMLFATEIVDGDGGRIAGAVVPVRIALSRTFRALTKDDVRRLITDAGVKAVAAGGIEQSLQRCRADVSAMAAGLSQRAGDLMRALDARSSPAVQASLFDRRQLQASTARDDARQRLRAHLSRTQARAMSLGVLTAQPARLLAAWLAD